MVVTNKVISKWCLSALALTAFSCFAETSSESAQVDALFETYAKSVRPGAAVMVIRDGEIIHSRGYGYADLAREKPITADTAFRLTSVSKAFTAMAVMMLEEQGKLNFDDEVREYIPQLKRFGPITLRHLLIHTSGLPDYYDVMDTSSGDPSNADVMDYYGTWGEPLFSPGERYEYSNPGYEILAHVVELVSGQSFASFMKEKIFVPTGMKDSVIHDHTLPVIPERAIGYETAGDGFVLNDYDPLNGITGSGGQYSSINDFYRWGQALQHNTLVSEETMQQALTAASASGGDEFDYGFGWVVSSYRGHKKHSHSGSWVGFRMSYAHFPDVGLSIAVLMNIMEGKPVKLSNRVADIYFDSDFESDPKLDSE
jgi:CubicO group peptidase (beta-lactamase class C family)